MKVSDMSRQLYLIERKNINLKKLEYMEHTDKFDGSKFKFEYLKDRKIGRFFITDKNGDTNIFDMPVSQLIELHNEFKSKMFNIDINKKADDRDQN